jgi:putative effector of murein hydrolase LrgA (UPF0299 family)
MLQQCFVWRVFVAVSHHKTNTWVTGKPFISKKCRLDVSFWPKSKPVTCQVSHSPTPLRWKSLATTSRVVVGVATLYAVDRCFASILARLSITFPSSLAGMLFTFISLLALQKVELYSKSVSEHIFDWFLPSVQFLARWLAVFFVPNLVLLPLFPVKDPLEVLRMVILVVVSFLLALKKWINENNQGLPHCHSIIYCLCRLLSECKRASMEPTIIFCSSCCCFENGSSKCFYYQFLEYF